MKQTLMFIAVNMLKRLTLLKNGHLFLIMLVLWLYIKKVVFTLIQILKP